MFVSFILSILARHKAFSWKPDVDLSDNAIYSTLLPFGHS